MRESSQVTQPNNAAPALNFALASCSLPLYAVREPAWQSSFGSPQLHVRLTTRSSELLHRAFRSFPLSSPFPFAGAVVTLSFRVR